MADTGQLLGCFVQTCIYICPLELFSCSDGAARQTRLVFQRAGDADELSAGGQISCGSSCGTWSRAA